MNDKEILSRSIQEDEFALLELNLYLDTYRYDRMALMEYISYAQNLMMLKYNFDMKYGPLMNFGFSPSVNGWRWIEGPWPWE